MNADGSDQRRITDNRNGDYAPAFSPDGTQVAFQSTRRSGSEIFVVPVAGGRTASLTSNRSGDFVPSWLPDSPPATIEPVPTTTTTPPTTRRGATTTTTRRL